MNFKFFRYKKGFSLVECTVSLLLFSIITTSVLTVFSVSRNQIKKQNEKYKIDLLADNILSGFQGCNDWDSFQSLLKNDLKINTDDVPTEEETLPIGTDGEIGEYGFNTNDIPVPVPFEKIVVKDGYATFEDKKENKLVSFAGNYTNNKLQDNDEFNWQHNKLFNENEKKTLKSMTLSGLARPTISFYSDAHFKYTLEINESKIRMTYGDFSKEMDSSSFDKYLLKNAYYLKCIEGNSPNLFNVTDSGYYYFQVYDVISKSAIQFNGKNLYYYIYYNKPYYTCNSQLAHVADNKGTDCYYFDLSGCTIKYLIADNLQKQPDIFLELTDENGNKFDDGNWYFYPWLAFRKIDDFSPTCSNYEIKQTYYEYTTKEGVNSEIYYALNLDNTLLLFNSDGQLLFPYSGDTTDALGMLRREEEPYCHFTKKTRWVYNDQSYDKWYQQGEMPSKTITKVKFVDNNSQNGKSKIIFYSDDEQPYITFQYSDYEQYKNDRNTIIDFSGSYSDCYKYEKKYSIREQNITNSDIINGWKIGNIADKLNQSFNNTTKTIQYYTKETKLDGWIIKHLIPNYADFYKYYTYSATIKAHNEIEQLNYIDKTLTVNRNGDAVEYNVNETAEAKLEKVSQVTEVVRTGNCDVTGNKKSLPNANLQIQSDDLSDYKPDNIGNNQKVLNKAKSEWESSSDNGTATATKTQNEKPDNFDFDNIGGWSLKGELTEAELYTQGVLSSFKGDGDSFDISIDSKTVFTAHTTDFIITSDGRSVNNTGCTYEIVAEESANVILQTCYIKGEFADMNVIAVVTYSNCTKKIADNDEIKEPKIVIWSVPKSKCPSDIKQITNAEYKNYKYISYRKG